MALPQPPTPIQFYVTGVPYIWVGVGGTQLAKQPLLLGTPQGKVTVQILGAKVPVYNSAWGKSHEADVIWDGELAIISFLLNYMDHAVAERLMSQPDPWAGTPGTNAVGELGTMLGSEGKMWPLWVPAPGQRKEFGKNQRAGYRFWACSMESPKEVSFQASEEKPFPMVIKAIRLPVSYNATTPLRASFQAGFSSKLMLYDDDMSEIVTPPTN